MAAENPLPPSATYDRMIVALESCANKLESLGRTFSGTNFTDRYGDGPICLGLAKHARAMCDEARETTISETLRVEGNGPGKTPPEIRAAYHEGYADAIKDFKADNAPSARGKLTDEQIMNAAITAADDLDASRVSEMVTGGWKATTIFEGDTGLLRFGRLIEKAINGK